MASNPERPVSNEYWANAPLDEIGGKVLDQIDFNHEYMMATGRYQLWRRAWELYYYQQVRTGGDINSVGQQGEFYQINVNHFRNIMLNLKNLTLTQKPSWQASATNSDFDSQQQCILANSLLEYYMREKNVSDFIETAVEYSLIFGEGFVSVEWDPNLGDVYGSNPVSGTSIHEGDITFDTFTPFDIYRDFSQDNGTEFEWIVTRKWQNRYNLMAQYPQFADKIVALPNKASTMRVFKIQVMAYQETDLVAVYTFYHKPTPACPNGRIVRTCEDNDIIFFDGPLPYREIPVYRIVPEEQHGSVYGYASANDLLPLQQGIDMLHSTILTNQATFGVQNIMAPKGSGLNVMQIGGGGLNLIEYDKNLGPPQALSLVQSAPELFNYLNLLEKSMELVSGVNSVARGNPESSLKSGSALALVQSQAIQFSMGLQNNYATLLSKVGTGVINILRVYANTPRTAAIVGKNNRSKMLSFTKKDIEKINRVNVQMGNPMLDTVAGKVNLADSLAQHGLIENANQYIMVLETGKLDPVIEGKEAELLLIRSENEAMSDGNPVQALILDMHAEHIQEHKNVLADPSARSNPQLVQLVLSHIQEHINLLQQASAQNPELLVMTGQQPLPPPAPPPGMMPPAPPNGNPANAAGGPSHGPSHPLPHKPHNELKSPGPAIQAGSMMANGVVNPVTQEAAQVKGPRMPKPPGV